MPPPLLSRSEGVLQAPLRSTLTSPSRSPATQKVIVGQLRDSTKPPLGSTDVAADHPLARRTAAAPDWLIATQDPSTGQDTEAIGLGRIAPLGMDQVAPRQRLTLPKVSTAAQNELDAQDTAVNGAPSTWTG